MQYHLTDMQVEYERLRKQLPREVNRESIAPKFTSAGGSTTGRRSRI